MSADSFMAIFVDDWAYKQALRRAAKRRVKTLEEAMSRRHVLIAMPLFEEDQRAVWRFIDSIDLDRNNVTLVRPTSLLMDVPAQYIGRVRVLGKEDHSRWTGLPRQHVVNEIWSKEPDVALDLHFDYDLTATYIIGASPACVRIGFHHKQKEPFLDMMINTREAGKRALDAMTRYLKSVQPDLIPIK